MSDEAHFSAEQPGPRSASRVSSPDGDRGWPHRDSQSSGTRTAQAVGLNSLVDAASTKLTVTLRSTTLTKRADFVAANAGRRVPMPGFVLLARHRADADSTARIGFTVTKRIGNAVVRNRMKRRLRAIARAVLPGHGLAGTDHVLIARSGGIERDFTELRAELTKALARAAR